MTAIGSGKLNKDGSRAKPLLSKGDMVIFGKYAGTDVEVGGAEFKILRESEILARVES